MSTKSIIFVSLIELSIISRISSSSSIVIIPKYGKKTINSEEELAFLEISDFDSGEKIYISITPNSGSSFITKLYFQFCDSTNGINKYLKDRFVDYSSSSSSLGEYTYNYKIKKDSSNAKYLYLDSSLPYPITIENTKNDTSVVIIIIIVVVFVVLVVVIIIIICCCRRCRPKRYGVVPYPGPYGVQPVVPVVQPVVQPVMQPVRIPQPYDYNPLYNQYNQAAQASIGTDVRDVRVNQSPAYEKPL